MDKRIGFIHPGGDYGEELCWCIETNQECPDGGECERVAFVSPADLAALEAQLAAKEEDARLGRAVQIWLPKEEAGIKGERGVWAQGFRSALQRLHGAIEGADYVIAQAKAGEKQEPSTK
jgi:hypothetical protein